MCAESPECGNLKIVVNDGLPLSLSPLILHASGLSIPWRRTYPMNDYKKPFLPPSYLTY